MHRAVPLTWRAAVAMAPKRKLAVAAAAPKAAKAAKAKPALVPADDSAAARADLTIEHWATKLAKLVSEAKPEWTVVVNPTKPRRGCFEVKDADGNTHVSLLDMARPFTKLKALDIDELADKIVADAAAKP